MKMYLVYTSVHIYTSITNMPLTQIMWSEMLHKPNHSFNCFASCYKFKMVSLTHVCRDPDIKAFYRWADLFSIDAKSYNDTNWFRIRLQNTLFHHWIWNQDVLVFGLTPARPGTISGDMKNPIGASIHLRLCVTLLTWSKLAWLHVNPGHASQY